MKTVFLRPQMPPSARQACRAPVRLPDRAINAAETTGFWGRDRVALRECETRRKAAVSAIEGTVNDE